MSDYIKWVTQTYNSFYKRIHKRVAPQIIFDKRLTTHSFWLYIPNTDILISVSLDKLEYEMNNYRQRQKLIKTRRLDAASELEGIANEIFKACKKLRG